MSRTIPVPYDSFLEIDQIKWIICRNWATGGSAQADLFANVGILNDPINNLWGNTKYLKVRIDDLREEYDLHLVDVNAHSSAITNRIESFISGWVFPPQKIKAALSEDEGFGITNEDIEGAAEIQESKLHLELRGKARPQLLEGVGPTYTKTSEFSSDIMALYRRIASNSNSFSLSQYLGEAAFISGWITPIPLLVDQNSPGSFKVVGNRIAYVHDAQSVHSPSVFVKGIPIYLGSDPIDVGKDFIGTFLMECGIEYTDSYFSDISSINMYQAPTENSKVTRQDIVFLELWLEDIPSNVGVVVPYGNTFYIDRDSGYSGIRYRHTTKGLNEESSLFNNFVSNPDNLAFINDRSKLTQLKSRVRLAMGKSDLSECAPQGHLPVPVDVILDESSRFYSTAVKSGNKIRLTRDDAELYTGNIVRLSGNLPTGLEYNKDYYVIRPNELGNEYYIQLALTYTDCYDGNFISIPAITGVDIRIDLSVNTHDDIELTEEAFSQLFDTYLPTDQQWESGTPVKFEFPDGKVEEKLPEFFDDAIYFVDQVRPGWVTIYSYNPPHSIGTTLVRLPLLPPEDEGGGEGGGEEEEPKIAGKIVLTSDKYGFSEEINLCDYTLEKFSGYIRTDKEWGKMHPVKITKKDTTTYLFTEKGEIASDRIYYISKVMDSEGNFSGILICNTYEDSLNGIGMNISDFRSAANGAVTLKRSHVFSKSLSDPSCYKAFIANDLERSDVLAIPLFSVNRRNSGIFHPSYNPNGCALAVRGVAIESVNDCFDPAKISTFNPDTKEIGTWADAISESSELNIDTLNDITEDISTPANSGKIVLDNAWNIGTEVQFTLTSRSYPGGIESGKTYYIYSSELISGKYNIGIVAIKGSTERIILTKSMGGIMAMFSNTENIRVKFQDQSNPETPTTVFKTGYSGYKEKGKTSAGLYYGITGRPDGLYYDVIDIGDIVDLRHQLVLDGSDLSSVLSKNLDILFRGANITTPYMQKMSDGSESGIKAPLVLQVDTLDVSDSPETKVIGSIINHRKSKEFAGKTIYSNDFLDGLRRTWSDSPIIQNEADIVIFGDSLNELPPSFLDLNDVYGLSQTRTANFSHSTRLGDTVSPKQILDIDYYVLKYRSLEGGGTNKLALVGVKIARGGEASGDYEGAKTDDTLRTLTFEPMTLDTPYRVLDVHSESVSGEYAPIVQIIKTDMQIKKVTALNNNRSVDIEVVPFRMPKPLQYGDIYYLFEHPEGDGYYRLSTSLRPSSAKESIGFIADGDFFPGNLYGISEGNTSTKNFDHGIMIKPLFSIQREAIRRNVTLNIEESYIATRSKVNTGTEVRFSYPDNFSDTDFTYGLPPKLAANTTFYAIESGRVQIGENYYYRVRLAETGQDAIAGNYFEFGPDSMQDQKIHETGDLFFVDIGSVPYINVILDYPHIMRPLTVAGDLSSENKNFSVLETGCPVTLIPNGSDQLPKPYTQHTVYYVYKVSNQEVYLCESPSKASEGIPIELEEEGGRYVFTINPGVFYPRNVLLPSSDVILTGADGKWNSGTIFRMIDPNTAGLMYIKDGVETPINNPEELLFYAIEIDSRRFKVVLASGDLPGVTPATIGDLVTRNYDLLTLSASVEGVLDLVPVSLGMRGNVVVEGESPNERYYLELQNMVFDIPVGTKIRFTEAPSAGFVEGDSYTFNDVSDIDEENDLITVDGTFYGKISDGDEVFFEIVKGPLAKGLNDNTKYYIKKVNNTNKQIAVSVSEALTPLIDISINIDERSEVDCTNDIDADTNEITIDETLFALLADGDRVFFTTKDYNVPLGLEANTLYYVAKTNYDTFRITVSNTNGGSALDLSDTYGVAYIHLAGTSKISKVKSEDPYASSLPPVLDASKDYYIAARRGKFSGGKQKVELALTYSDAYNAYIERGNPTLINLSGIENTVNVQVIGFPAKMMSVLKEGKKVGDVIVSGGYGTLIRIPEGTPVFIDYYSDSPTYTGRNFPEGLSRNRLYYTSEVSQDGRVLLYNSPRDIIEGSPITFDNPPSTDLYFQIIPAARVEEVEFSSDHRLTEVQVPNDWPYDSITDITGIPIELVPTVLDEQFPIVSGLRPNKVYYGVRTSEDRIGFCLSFKEAVSFGNSDLVSFITASASDIDTEAYMEFIPQPVDVLGDPLKSYTFSADLVNTIDNTIRVSAKFLTGTPVYFNPFSAGSLGEDIQINSTYYVIVRRVIDENAPTLDICLVDTLEAAYVYDSRKPINSIGQGSMKIIPTNRAEIAYTAGNKIVVLNDYGNSWLRNSIQTTQNWITASPVRVQNVGEGLLPQYYEYGDKPSLPGENDPPIDIPVDDIDIDLDTLSDIGKPSYSTWDTVLSGGEAVKVTEVGNDIPSGLVKNQIYYICGKTNRDGKYYFKLAPSYQDALTSVGANIRYVTSEGILAMSSWRLNEEELISMGSGYLDLTSNTIKVQNEWPSGVPVKLVPSSGSTLPVGLSSSDFYFTYAYGPNQIQLIEDLRDYFRFRFGGYSAYGSTGDSLPVGSPSSRVPEDMPRIIAISDTDTLDPTDPSFVPVIDSYLEGGDPVRIWVDRAGETSPGQYTQIDKIKFGTVEIVPESGWDFFPYQEESESGRRYIDVLIPSYPQDSIVEISIRKKTLDGEYLWSPSIMFVYTSTKMPILIKLTPSTVHPDWETPLYYDTFWSDFAGKLSVVLYAPNGFFDENSSTVQIRHFAVGNTKPLPENQDVDYIEVGEVLSSIKSIYDLRPGIGYVQTPFFKIEFDYTPPPIEHISGIPTEEVLVMNSEVSLVTNDISKLPLSLNTLSLTNMSKLDAVEVPYFLAVSAQKAYSSPKGEIVLSESFSNTTAVDPDSDKITLSSEFIANLITGDPVYFVADPESTLPTGISENVIYYVNKIDSTHIKLTSSPGGNIINILADGTNTSDIYIYKAKDLGYDFNKDIVFGRDDSESVIRMIVPGFSSPNTLITFEDTDTGRKIQRPAVSTVEYWNRNDDTEFTNKHLVEVLYVSVPKRMSSSHTVKAYFSNNPDVLIDIPYMTVSSPFIGHSASGNCLGDVEVEFLGDGLDSIDHVYLRVDFVEEVEEYKKKYEVTVLKKEAHSISIAIPPLLDHSTKSISEDKNVEFEFCSSNGSTISHFAYKGGLATIPQPKIDFVSPSNLFGDIYDTNKVKNEQGILITAVGNNLTDITKITLTRVDDTEPHQTYEITSVSSEINSCWFNLPVIDDIASTSGPYDAMFNVTITNAYGKEASLSEGNYLKIKANANYNSFPVISSISPLEAFNSEDSMIVLKGFNLSDATSVQFGSQYLNVGQFSVIPGIGGGLDTISFFSRVNGDKGIIPVVVKTNYGGSIRFTSYPVFFFMKARHSANIQTEGSGDFEIQTKTWNIETFSGGSKVHGGPNSKNLLEIYQNLPTGLPVRIKKSTGKYLPYSEGEYGDNRIFYIVNMDLRRVKLTGKRTGNPVPLSTVKSSVKLTISSINAADNKLTTTSDVSILENGNEIFFVFSGIGNNPIDISENRSYWVTNLNKTAKTFQVLGNITDLDPVDITSSWSGTTVNACPIRGPLTISVIDAENNLLTTTNSVSLWNNGDELFFVFSGTGEAPIGITENKSYWVVSIDKVAKTFQVLDAPTDTNAVNITSAGSGITITAYSLKGSIFTIIDLPTIEDPLNPNNRIVDWDQGIARYFEQIDMSDGFSVNETSGSIIIKSRFWDSSKTIGFNPYYPPFTGDENTPLPLWSRTTDRLPTESSSPIAKSGYLFAREGWDTEYESGVNEELEYQINPMENPTYFVGLSSTFLGSISQTPKLVSLSLPDGNMGFTLEVVSDDTSELFESFEINPALDEFQTSFDMNKEGWVPGTPVILGSQLPDPLQNGKIYYNAGDPSKIILKEDMDDTSGTHVDLTENKGYGFFRLTPTYPELSANSTYYLEDVGNGRVRFYKSLRDLLDGSYFRFMISNETEMLIKPISEIEVVDLESGSFDTEANEVLNGSSHIISGTPLTFEAFDELSELPDGIENGKTYYAYRPSPSVFSLFDTWREVALLEGHTMHLAKSSAAVTMKLDFTGERILQTIDSNGNIDVPNSKIKLTLGNSHTDPQGTPVILVSDRPVLGKPELLEEGRGVDIRFYLRYSEGCGLTDRSVNVGIESRKGTELPGIKTVKDSYIVVDPRSLSESKGDTFYWGSSSVEDVNYPLMDDLTKNQLFNLNAPESLKLPKDRWELSLKGFYHALEMMDAIVPGRMPVGEIPIDETTITMGVENALMGYDGESGDYLFKYDDFLPGNLKGKDLYVAWVGYRVDYFMYGNKDYYNTSYAGFPPSYNEQSGIQVYWNKQTRTIKFTGVSKDNRITFRVGICSVDYTNREDIPPFQASTYSGSFDVGYVYNTNAQCKEVSLVAVKRILRSKGEFYVGTYKGYGWGSIGGKPSSWYNPDKLIPNTNRGFKDSCGFSWSFWKQFGDVEPGETPQEFQCMWTAPADCYFEDEGDLIIGDGTTEFLYFAGGKDNPIPAVPVKPSDGKVHIYYQRNPIKFDHSKNAITKLLQSDSAILSNAGSGNYRNSESMIKIRYQYPFLAFHIPTTDPTYMYRITGKMIDPDTYRIVSEDTSFVRVPIIGFVNNQIRVESDRFDKETDSLYTPLYAPQNPVKFETRVNSDGTLVLITKKDKVSPINTYPVISSRGSEMLTILPNLFLDDKELKGVLLINNGETSLEARFQLHGKPIMRSNIKGL